MEPKRFAIGAGWTSNCKKSFDLQQLAPNALSGFTKWKFEIIAHRYDNSPRAEIFDFEDKEVNGVWIDDRLGWEIVRLDRERKRISPYWKGYEDSPDPMDSD